MRREACVLADQIDMPIGFGGSFDGSRIWTIKKADYKKAIQFAIEGMHFNWYLDNKLLQNLYGRYFLYLEMSRATQAIAAYKGDELAGVLLCEMKGEAKRITLFGSLPM